MEICSTYTGQVLLLVTLFVVTDALKATLKCYGDMTVYVDGDLQIHPSDSGAFTKKEIPDKASLVAVTCTPTSDGKIGIRGYFSNGYMTDDTWRCNTEMIRDWYKPECSDDTWKRADVLASDGDEDSFPQNARHIWSGNEKRTVYCRRKIDHVNLRVACFGKNLNVFVDDRRYMKHDEGMDLIEMDLPHSPRLVAISCDMTSDPKGLIATSTNGLITDFSWKCSSRFEENWHTLAFDDKYWTHPYKGYYNKPGTNLHKDTIREDAAWMYVSYHTYCRRRLGSTMRAVFDESGIVYTEGKYRGKTENKMDIWSYNLLPETTLVSVISKTDSDKAAVIATFSNDIGDVSWKCQTSDEHLWWTSYYNDSKWKSAATLDQNPTQLSDLFEGETWVTHSESIGPKTTNCRGQLRSHCDCQHTCVMTATGSFQCACPEGYTLDENGKRCSSVGAGGATGKNSKGVAAGVIVTLLIMSVFAAVVIFWIRRRKRIEREKYRTLQVGSRLSFGELETNEEPSSISAVYRDTTYR